ncbi:Adenosine (5')-pentaphospho-(5'')-adenosine pyrophosphohydrolase [Thioalkalivibrio nitratireducens DSM 14787]|uniref:RNA pyrophosphohydrolase n=1 Tax=Thioalkalivibrio nitratireducens (strain DSM 14787 / UNIQEM 213 / ALEN2) TaxID=1255043 RepID=L0E1K3_THIND|nr:RNA pyrophosphohydrolase [Thioalkalivibrio nitratireducens]AGA35085.1 Adenosine (5')-pentaphospho-(5'')-adenosine pyrophosphohydrolase [Thioalkalivibrio nitratireducens DSM 14787]
MQVIDCDGYRPNVGIILCNGEQQLFWGKRVGQDAWQFPQGGIRQDEAPEDALFRELREETGLLPEHVRILGVTRNWLRYRLPSRMVRRRHRPVCVGQKQRWFLLQLTGTDADFRLDLGEPPEFDAWRWIDYWRPVHEVVYFKRDVYRRALCELVPLMFPELARDPGCPRTAAPRRVGS